MGSRLFEEIREKRGLCYSVYATRPRVRRRAVLQLGSGLDSAKCIEAYTRMREIVDELRDDGPTEEEVAARPRLRRRPARARLRELRRGRPLRRQSQIVFGEDIDPDAAIAALDAVTYDEVREVAAGVADNLAVACVGPHDG